MDLRLDSSIPDRRLPIKKLIVHDENGFFLFALVYDPIEDKIVTADQQNQYDEIITAKKNFTDMKGIEAYGSYISGARNSIPQYTYFLSLYHNSQGIKQTYQKYHVTLSTFFENLGWQKSLLLSVECYGVLSNMINTFINGQSIQPEDFPLIRPFFSRIYQSSFHDELLHGEISEPGIFKAKQKIKDTLSNYGNQIEGATLYFMTLSSSIVGSIEFSKVSTLEKTLQLMSHTTVTSSGVLLKDNFSLSWFPFTKGKLGKIKRSLLTILDTFEHASPEKNMNEQIQNNLAYKFQELSDIILTEIDVSYGLQTNIGFLISSILFADSYKSDLKTQLELTDKLATIMKNYGQTILSYAAKKRKFDPIK